MSPYQFKSKPSKMVKPPTTCDVCNKNYINARALVQHNQTEHMDRMDLEFKRQI